MLARTPDLAPEPIDAVAFEVRAPMAVFTHRIGHHLERRDVDRVVDLVPRDESLALGLRRVAEAVDFPRQQRPLGEQRRIGRRRGDADVGVRGRRMRIERRRVVEERLAEPVEVSSRQPLRLREEVVEPAVGSDRERLVVEQPLELDAGELVLVVVPFVLVILFEEGAIAEPADLRLGRSNRRASRRRASAGGSKTPGRGTSLPAARRGGRGPNCRGRDRR